MIVKFRARHNRVNANNEMLIECVIRHNKEQSVFSVDKRVSVDNWKNRDKKYLLYLMVIETKLYEIELYLIRNKVDYSANDVRMKYFNQDSISLSDCINLFLDDIYNRNLNHCTKYSYKRIMDILVDSIGNKQIDKIVINDIDILVRSSRDKGYSHLYTRKLLITIRSFFRFCISNKYIMDNPASGIKLKRVDRTTTYLTNQEVELLTKLSYNNSKQIVLDSFILSCYTGLSFSDLYNLSKDDIKSIGDTLMIIKPRCKTKTISRVPLLPQAISILEKYNYNIPMLKRSTSNVYLKIIAKDANIDKRVSFHVARHTFATSITLANGISLNILSKMLGHSSITMTEHYAKVLDESIINEMKRLIK